MVEMKTLRLARLPAILTTFFHFFSSKICTVLIHTPLQTGSILRALCYVQPGTTFENPIRQVCALARCGFLLSNLP